MSCGPPGRRPAVRLKGLDLVFRGGQGFAAGLHGVGPGRPEPL